MKKTIMIISSDYTGHGHKSIEQALTEQLKEYGSMVNIHVVQGFEWGRGIGNFLEHIYNPLTVHARWGWEIIYNFYDRYPKFFNAAISFLTEESFIRQIKEIKPDLIVSIHPGFVGSVINLLEKYKIAIPVVDVVADLVSASSLWFDWRLTHMLCPNVEVKECMVKKGMAADKISVLGFPVRKQFYEYFDDNEIMQKINQGVEKIPNILILSSSETKEQIIRIIKKLLNQLTCNITIVCGRNEKLKEQLNKQVVPIFKERVEILGYLPNLEMFMHSHDLLITKGGPNIIMEAVQCCIPLCIIGALPGQEQGNPDFVDKNGLGINCCEIAEIEIKIEQLFKNDNHGLIQIMKNQYRHRDILASKRIVSFLIELIERSKATTENKDHF